MSAEARRRTGTHGRRGLLRDRPDTFSMSGSICVAGVAGVACSVPAYRCPRKLDDEVGQIDAAAFCVTGVALSASRAGCVWQAWRLFKWLSWIQGRCRREFSHSVLSRQACS